MKYYLLDHYYILWFIVQKMKWIHNLKWPNCSNLNFLLLSLVAPYLIKSLGYAYLPITFINQIDSILHTYIVFQIKIGMLKNLNDEIKHLIYRTSVKSSKKENKTLEIWYKHPTCIFKSKILFLKKWPY